MCKYPVASGLCLEIAHSGVEVFVAALWILCSALRLCTLLWGVTETAIKVTCGPDALPEKLRGTRAEYT